MERKFSVFFKNSGRVLDLASTAPASATSALSFEIKKHVKRNLSENLDDRAARNDWVVVGNHIQNAMNQEKERCNND